MTRHENSIGLITIKP